jgi:flagellar basal-body rod modification protein FlgD
VSAVNLAPIYNSTSANDSSSSSSPMSDAMGMDAFLKMFMAQVTNQNPLDPMDNTEYTAQLATFSSLEQLTQINDSMSAIAGLKETVEQGNIVNYIGKGVTLSGDVLPIAQGYVGKVGYALAKDADVSVTITDESGSVVATMDLGRHQAGVNSFQWDAKDNGGLYVPDGAYKVTIMAHDDQGNPIEVTDQTVNGLVTGYQKGADGANYLLLGDVALPVGEVLAVYQIPTAPADPESASYNEMNYASSSSDEEYRTQEAKVNADAADSDEPSFGEKILKSIISLGGLAAALL